MRIGKYKNQEVKVYDDGNNFKVEFPNTADLFTMSDVSEINFDLIAKDVVKKLTIPVVVKSFTAEQVLNE